MEEIKKLSKSELQHTFIVAKNGNRPVEYSDSDFRKAVSRLGFPPYLLSTEMTTILHYTKSAHQQAMISTLWHTGATINEVIHLSRKSFTLNKPYPNINITNHDFYNSSISYDDKLCKHRVVPLISSFYTSQIKKLFATLRLSGDSTYHNAIWSDGADFTEWVSHSLRMARYDGIIYNIDITADSIRNSFAMKMLLSGIEPTLVMKLMGYRSKKNLELYLKVKCLIDSISM